MSDPPTAVADLVAGGSVMRQSVEKRIERRLEVLREWLRDGIPAGKEIPGNLRAAREWDDPELGIASIASPNEFTTTHHLHGRLVRDVAGLLTALKKRFDRPGNKPGSRSPRSVDRFDRKAFDRQLETAVSQWHSERDGRLQEKKRADAAEARSVILLEENRQKDDLIADLRRQLAAQKGLRVVE